MAVGTPLGTVRYNGYTFEDTSSANVNVEFVYDDLDRTLVSQRNILTIKWVVATDNADLDSTVTNIRKRLGEPGRSLEFSARGFGVEKIGLAGNTLDVLSGPKPRGLKWNPVAGAKSAELEWVVEWVTPVCTGAARLSGVMALNHGVTFAINQGLTTRTIVGYIQIAKPVINGKSTGITADQCRDCFQAVILDGFTRDQTWTVSPDRSRIDFQIIDREIDSPNAYPLGARTIDISHRVVWNRQKSAVRYGGVISGTVTLLANMKPRAAWDIFVEVANKRISEERANEIDLFIESFNIDESLFGSTHSFSLTYRIMSSISAFIGDHNLFKPLGGTWKAWAFGQHGAGQSLLHNRGAAKLADDPSADRIVNLCTDQQVGHEAPLEPMVFRDVRHRDLKNEEPTKDKSWVTFSASLIVIRNCQVTRQKFLQNASSDENFHNSVLSPVVSGTPNVGVVYNPASQGSVPDVLQVDGEPNYLAIFSGVAERLTHKIPRPGIETVGDQPATEMDSKILQKIVGNMLGQPLWRQEWLIVYGLPTSPGTVDPPAHNKDCVGTDQVDKPEP